MREKRWDVRETLCSQVKGWFKADSSLVSTKHGDFKQLESRNHLMCFSSLYRLFTSIDVNFTVTGGGGSSLFCDEPSDWLAVSS